MPKTRKYTRLDILDGQGIPLEAVIAAGAEMFPALFEHLTPSRSPGGQRGKGLRDFSGREYIQDPCKRTQAQVSKLKKGGMPHA